MQTAPTKQRLIDIKETQHRLSQGKTSVYALFQQNELTPIKMGRATRVLEAQVDALIERRAAEAQERAGARKPVAEAE
jgi:predicted DNA-binding transcriptional regulator AlpA